MKIPRAESVPVLPDEVIVEILSWVPVKSLMRFRCVSKSWKSLIYDPSFVKLHLQKSIKNTQILLTLEDITREYDDTDLCAVPCSVRSLLDNPSSTIAEDGCYRLKTKYWVCGSWNGLVCLRGSFDRKRFDEYWVRFWNPSTRLTSERSPCLHVSTCLRPFQSTKFGFGYDNSSDTYKVVAVIWCSKLKKMELKVYSMGDNCWRYILSIPSVPFVGQFDGQFVSGTLNWLALRNNSSDYAWETVTIDQLVIFSFDLGKETYKQLLLPAGLDEVPHVEPNLGVLRDCLCFFHDYKRTHFVVWQMKEFGNEKSWTQLLNVSYQHLQIDTDPYHPLLPLCTSENGDVVMLANNEDLEAIVYNRRDDRVEHIKIPNNKVWLHVKDYVQSLVLPS